MHIQKPDITKMKVEPLFSKFADDPIVQPLLQTFSDLLSERVAALETAVAEEIWPEITRLAHLIRGSAGSYGYEEIMKCGEQIELAATAKVIDERILENLARLQIAAHRVNLGLASH